MGKINTRSVIQSLIILGISLTPLFTIEEVYALLTGPVPDTGIVNIYVKMIKDIILIGVILLSAIAICQRRYFFLNVIYLLFFCLFVASILITTLTRNDLFMIVAGIRWGIPLVVAVLLAGLHYVDDKFQRRIARILFYLFIIAFCLQTIELIFMPHHFGTNFFGLSKRNPGIFSKNITMAFFSLTVFYYAIYFEQGALYRKIVYVLLPFSIFMTSSGTGIVALLATYFYLLFRKPRSAYLKGIMAIASLFAVALTAKFLPLISGRSDIYVSILTRVGIFSKEFNSINLIVSDKFGSATNTGKLLSYNFPVKGLANLFFIADSTWTSILANVGLLGLILFGLMLLIANNKTHGYYVFMIVFGLFSLTIIIFEIFPMNLLFAVNMAYFSSTRKINKTRPAVVSGGSPSF